VAFKFLNVLVLEKYWCYYTQVSYTGSWEPLVLLDMIVNKNALRKKATSFKINFLLKDPFYKKNWAEVPPLM
jgi:hypothetical protein